MEIDNFELRKMLKDAAEYAVMAYRIEKSEESPYLSYRQACKTYGKGVVDKWIKIGVVGRCKDGDRNCKIRLAKLELDVAAKTSNI